MLAYRRIEPVVIGSVTNLCTLLLTRLQYYCDAWFVDCGRSNFDVYRSEKQAAEGRVSRGQDAIINRHPWHITMFDKVNSSNMLCSIVLLRSGLTFCYTIPRQRVGLGRGFALSCRQKKRIVTGGGHVTSENHKHA